MTSIEITGASVAAIIAAGAYIRWGVKPVVLAYRIGRGAGRLTGRWR